MTAKVAKVAKTDIDRQLAKPQPKSTCSKQRAAGAVGTGPAAPLRPLRLPGRSSFKVPERRPVLCGRSFVTRDDV
jgi:hypothetical protein